MPTKEKKAAIAAVTRLAEDAPKRALKRAKALRNKGTKHKGMKKGTTEMAMVLQGKYMGLLNSVTKSLKVKAKQIRVTKGAQAAIKFLQAPGGN